MFFSIQNGKLEKIKIENIAPADPLQYFGYKNLDSAEVALEKLGFSFKLIADCSSGRSMFFENYEDYDFLSLEVPGAGDTFLHAGRVYIYQRKNLLFFVLDDAPRAETILKQNYEDGIFAGFDRILNNFLERLIDDDCDKIDSIEQEISDLENALLDSNLSNCSKEIAALRKRLLVLKRYYEQFLDVLDELLENENESLSETALRYLRIFDGKVDRRYHTVLNLRDYVTQVREAYQAEIDIGLNNIMKIFTVITAVFLPLSLLVGWYGMNVKMPEYGWSFGYPMVITLSISIVVACLAFFKKKRWF